MASEYLAPTILSSRRLFGPNRYSVSAGAVLDVVCDSAQARRAVAHWPAEALRLATALAWPLVPPIVQFARDHASLFLAAPVDGLLTATDLTEHAWVAAEARAAADARADTAEAGQAATATTETRDDAITLLTDAYAREQAGVPHVMMVREYATHHALCYSQDDEGCSVGVGAGARVVRWIGETMVDAHALAVPALEDAYDVPTALITGSNGKTTTTRLVASMARAAGLHTGWSCSDGVWIDGEQVESGDFTGPGGARRVVCDPAVRCAVLETARGGMLRRGLAVDRADTAVITNISADHFGEYGVEDLGDLARAKLIVARALRPGAPLVLNADDHTLRSMSPELTVPVAWFTTTHDPEADARVESGVRETGLGVRLRQARLLLHAADGWQDLGTPSAMPVTLEGRAAHNIANIAAATLVAAVMRIPIDVIRRTLAQFGSDHADNPGRLTVRELDGVTLVMDYAHNPEGMAALCRTAAALPAARRLLLLGQAGNRDDAQLRALARSAWETQPFDRVIIKDMVDMLRGRPVGEVPAILRDALHHAGAPADVITIAGSELDGVRDALTWARAGDVLVLGVHVSRAAVHALVERLAADGWRAGEPLPTSP